MYGIRCGNHYSLVVQKRDLKAVDAGPVIGGLTFNMWVFDTEEESLEELKNIKDWYKRHNLMSTWKLEVFELTGEDLNEILITALKWKSR